VDRKFGFVLLSAAIFLVTIIVMAQSLVDTLLLRYVLPTSCSRPHLMPRPLALISVLWEPLLIDRL
jgi:hypothetical protein